MITQESIDALKAQLDVVDVVGSYVELKKAGANFKAPCPFHDENTASFVVSPSKQIYHCFGCLPGYQELCTPNGYTKIEDIKVGDEVFSATAKVTKVIKTYQHESEYNLLGFRTSLTKEYSYFTQNHDMLVVKKADIVKNLPYVRVEKNRPLKFYGRIKKYNKKSPFNISFKTEFANDVKVDDYFLYPCDRETKNYKDIDVSSLWSKNKYGPNVKKINKIPISEDFMWLAGIYVAEGSSYRGGIKFSLSSKELDYANKIIRIIKEVFNIEASLFYPKNRKNSLEVTASSSNLEYIFKGLFKKGAANKEYPYFFNYLSKPYRESLFNGLMDGDGCYSSSTYDTISDVLANQILDLAISLEKIPSCRIYEAYKDKKGLKHKKSYTIYFKKRESLDSFYETIGETKYLFTRVKDITKIDFEDVVYDITVEDQSHTFMSKHFAVGNCGAGGDSIKFTMEYEKLNYPEAIEKLADTYNFTLSHTDKKNNKPRSQVMDKLNGYYQNLLTSRQEANAYLVDRGIYESSIEKFGIGYAPDSSSTINYITSQMFTLKEAVDVGVVGFDSGRYFSRFIERITFPIHSANGALVGFGGRTITGHQAKYVNSPETPFFNKSRLLYAYHHAKQTLHKTKEIIITEGYLDVIMLHQAGFNNAVATLGTALTPEHLPLLRKGEPKVIMAYDGDKAGRAAALKASKLLSASGFNGGVVIFGGGLDPADMVKEGHIEELASMFRSTKPFIEFVLDEIISLYDLKDPKSKESCMQEGVGFLKTLSPILQEEYKTYLASRLSISPSFIKLANQTNVSQTNNTQVINNSRHRDMWELTLIKTLLEKPHMLTQVLDVLDPSLLQFHQHEFSQLISNNTDDPSIMAISIDQTIKAIEDEDELQAELNTFLSKHYNRELKKINMRQDIPFEQKAFEIRRLRGIISKLK